MEAPQPNLDPYWQRAQEFMRAGEYENAAATYASILELDRQQPMAWLALASYAYSTGRFRSPVERARSAALAMRESRRYQGIADLAHYLHQLGESRLAVRLILEADWSDPVVLDSAIGLIQCLGLADQHADALRLIELTLAHDEGSHEHASARLPMLHHLRATMLRHLGRADEATAEYQQSLALAPDFAGAMMMLASHDPYADVPAQLARVRDALQRSAADAPQRGILEFAQFNLLDAADQTKDAWQALVRGAALMRSRLQYDPDAEERTYAAVATLCSASFVKGSSIDPASHTPIFIVGMPRTGTTVLDRLLGNHSRVASAGELNDFHQQLCWQTDTVTAEPADAALLRACPSLDFAAIGRGYLQRTHWRAGTAEFLIDKFPRNILYAGLIHKALPHAKIICLLRDPMDTCLSNLKELFSSEFYPHSWSPIETANHYLRFRRLLQHWDEVMPGVILTVRYDELVREPERVMRSVMDHCGLAFEPDCVDLLRNTSPSATASSSQIRKPLHARSIGAWRRYAEPLAEIETYLRARLPASEFSSDPALS
jgi:tetratricopeptide (TPR) repeat protein